jgi:hypothetical protein
VKELGLVGISAIEEANSFLSKTPIPKTSAKFAKLPLISGTRMFLWKN